MAEIKALLERNKIIARYTKALKEAGEKGDVVAVVYVLNQIKTKYLNIDSPGVQGPKELMALYQEYAEELDAVLSSGVLRAVFTNSLPQGELKTNITRNLVEALFANSIPGVEDIQRYRLVLWLLRDSLNEPQLQRLVRSCVKNCAKIPEEKNVPYDSMSLPHQPNQFLAYASLIHAAEALKKEYSNSKGNGAKPGYEKRYLLVGLLSEQKEYHPLAAQYLLNIPEIRAKIGLAKGYTPRIIDADLLDLKQPALLHPVNTTESFQNIDEERKAGSMIQSYTQSNKAMPLPAVTVQSIIERDVNILCGALDIRHDLEANIGSIHSKMSPEGLVEPSISLSFEEKVTSPSLTSVAAASAAGSSSATTALGSSSGSASGPALSRTPSFFATSHPNRQEGSESATTLLSTEKKPPTPSGK